MSVLYRRRAAELELRARNLKELEALYGSTGPRPGKSSGRVACAAQCWLLRELQDADNPQEVKADQPRKVVQLKDGSGVWHDPGAPGREDWVWFARASEYLSAAHLEVGGSFSARR